MRSHIQQPLRLHFHAVVELYPQCFDGLHFGVEVVYCRMYGHGHCLFDSLRRPMFYRHGGPLLQYPIAHSPTFSALSSTFTLTFFLTFSLSRPCLYLSLFFHPMGFLFFFSISAELPFPLPFPFPFSAFPACGEAAGLAASLSAFATVDWAPHSFPTWDMCTSHPP